MKRDEEIEIKNSSFWSSNFIPTRRRDERRPLGLHVGSGYGYEPSSSVSEIQVLSGRSTKQAGKHA